MDIKRFLPFSTESGEERRENWIVQTILLRQGGVDSVLGYIIIPLEYNNPTGFTGDLT